MSFQRIMTPVDFSETSQAAARHAAELASALGAQLLVVHVLHEPAFVMAYGSGYPSPAIADQYQNEMRIKLHGAAEALAQPGLKIVTKLEHGVPHESIVSCADAEQADLIVLGTHGRSGISHLLLGSVAERVVRLSKVPVLTIRKS